MKKMKPIFAIVFVIAIFASSTGLAKTEAKSLGQRSSSDKKWRPVFQVDRKISGYKIKIHSGKPIINTVQLLDSEKKKEFTYARYYGSGEVIKQEFGSALNVGKIKINMDKAQGSKIELWVYTQSDKKDYDKDDHGDRDRHDRNQVRVIHYPDADDYDHDDHRVIIGRYPRQDEYGQQYGGNGRYEGDAHPGYPAGGYDAGADHGDYISLGTVTPALRSQTIMWYIGGRISGLDIAVEHGRGTIRAVRLIGGDRILREWRINQNLSGGEGLKEDFDPKDITRIEVDTFDNNYSTFSLAVR